MLAPVLYVICLIFIVRFFSLKEFFKTLTVKEKLWNALAFLLLAGLPMYVLLGASKWVDYYTTDKHWRVVKATIINIPWSSSHRGTTDYLYTVKTGDSTIELSTTLRFPPGKVMYLKLCKTNLGMIIVDRYYDSIP